MLRLTMEWLECSRMVTCMEKSRIREISLRAAREALHPEEFSRDEIFENATSDRIELIDGAAELEANLQWTKNRLDDVQNQLTHSNEIREALRLQLLDAKIRPIN